jgi:hypothetical protein
VKDGLLQCHSHVNVDKVVFLVPESGVPQKCTNPSARISGSDEAIHHTYRLVFSLTHTHGREKKCEANTLDFQLNNTFIMDPMSHRPTQDLREFLPENLSSAILRHSVGHQVIVK